MMVEVVETVLKITGASPKVVAVKSKSQPDKMHKVLLACSCPSFRYRANCRHLFRAVGKLQEAAEKRLQERMRQYTYVQIPASV